MATKKQEVKQEKPAEAKPKLPQGYEGWVKVSFEEMQQHQADGTLMGYDKRHGLALIKKEQ